MRFTPSRRRSVVGRLALWLCVCFSSASAEAARVAGQLLNVKGHVEIQRARQPARKGTLLFQLQEGDLLRVREGGLAEVVLFRNGARFSLSRAGAARVSLTELHPVAGGAPQALPRLSAAFLSRKDTPPPSISPRFLGVLVRDPADPGVGPRDPFPNGVVRRAPVTLRWAGPVEGESLRLEISDGERVVHGADLPPTAREYRVEPGLLRPGQYYVWSVTAVRPLENGPWCGALLRLLPADEKAVIERLERESEAARAASPESPASQLLLAQTYERFGLLDDARAAYQEALRHYPQDAGLRSALKRLGRGVVVLPKPNNR